MSLEAPSTRLAAVADISEGEGRPVRLDGIEPLALFKVEGAVYVTQDTCSHARASLCQGWVEGHEICCPVHDGRFDVRTGAPLCFPATDALRIFPAEIRDGAVWADLRGARPLAPGAR